jgi:SAM-dependent methyltransferase
VPAVFWQQGIPGFSVLERVAARVPAAVIVASSSAAVSAQRQLSPHRRVELLHLGAEVDDIARRGGTGLELRRNLGLGNHPTIGIVGRLQPWKGQDIFLRAAALLAGHCPEARFFVVGGAGLREEGYLVELERLVHDLPELQGRVKFVGHQTDIYPWYEALDVVVHASRGEPFGLVLVEAMALGRPLVAAAEGGPLEIVEDGQSGLLVPTGDVDRLAEAILGIVRDSRLAAHLSQGARRRAATFSADHMARRWAEVLRSAAVCQRGSRERRKVVAGPPFEPSLLFPDSEAMAGKNTHETVAHLLDPPARAIVIDAGPGLGSFTERLTAIGHRPVAIGVAPEQFLVKYTPYVQADLDVGLPLDAASVTGMVAIEVIEHLEAPLRFFREAGRCLRTGGWLIVTTPNTLSLASKLSFALRNRFTYFGDEVYETNGHISPVSEIDIRRIAARSGFEVEHVTYNVGKLPIPKIRHRYPLKSDRFQTRMFGESLIMKLRKVGPPAQHVVRSASPL